MLKISLPYKSNVVLYNLYFQNIGLYQKSEKHEKNCKNKKKFHENFAVKFGFKSLNPQYIFFLLIKRFYVKTKIDLGYALFLKNFRKFHFSKYFYL